MKNRMKIFALLLSTSMLFSSCSTWDKLNDTERGAVIGGGTGAVVGGAAGGTGGAVVGGALGAVGGGLIGNEVRKDNRRR